MRPPSYIGVTGFMSRNEIEGLLSILRAEHKKTHHLMVGVLASAKTLRGEQNKWPGRTPRVEQISSIFVNDPLAINLVHFATDDRDTIDLQLMQLIDLAGPFFDGLQLNMLWPDSEQLRRVMKTKRVRRTVLQIGATAFMQVYDNPQELAKRLDDYDGCITDILFDLSGGHGRICDPNRAREVLQAVRVRHPNLGTGVAGGLSKNTLCLFSEIAREFPDMNIDAEGRLRTPHPEDALDLGETSDYLHSAIRLFNP